MRAASQQISEVTDPNSAAHLTESEVAHAKICDFKRFLKVARQLDYSAERLSKELKITRRQLERSTHKFLGCTPQGWLDEQRLFIAADLLKPGSRVKIVAFQLGFKQASHFSRQFKLYYGLSPKFFLDQTKVGIRSDKKKYSNRIKSACYQPLLQEPSTVVARYALAVAVERMSLNV